MKAREPLKMTSTVIQRPEDTCVLIIVASYIALKSITQWRSWCSNITPGRWAIYFIPYKPSQLPWEYTARAAKYVAQQAKSITRTISALTGTHLPMDEEEQL